ncbi:hypothetical protein [Thioalbus denitrificans]|uniref:hypothetical protein n=1 Tax=Thioalbus denitrificans TaxID=547122 RepID=UPI0011C041F4|nr:hypothetical protein [Thioalbus denitrificans]
MEVAGEPPPGDAGPEQEVSGRQSHGLYFALVPGADSVVMVLPDAGASAQEAVRSALHATFIVHDVQMWLASAEYGQLFPVFLAYMVDNADPAPLFAADESLQ